MTRTIPFLLALLVAGPASAQISVGSDGSDGAFAFAPDAPGGTLMTVDLDLAATAPWSTPSPVAGQGVYDPDRWAVVFKYSTITVPAGKTVRFSNHASRAPVVWLSQGDVLIDGEVDLDGADGHDAVDTSSWAEPGPGGFRGGRGWPTGSVTTGSAGFGPGGAFPSSHPTGGPAGHATAGVTNGSAPPGPAYGTPALGQLLGGSGGSYDNGPAAGRPGSGAGGGALLVAADTLIRVSGSIHANGGSNGKPLNGVTPGGGQGSGGALRLVADEIDLVSGADLRCLGSSAYYYTSTSTGGEGRVRLEANTHTLAALSNPVPSVGLPAPVFAPSQGRLRIASVAGVAVPADPQAALLDSFADVGIDGAGTRSVTLIGEGIPDQTPVELRVTDSLGDAVVVTGTLAATGQPGETGATLQVDFPASVVVLQARAVLP